MNKHKIDEKKRNERAAHVCFMVRLLVAAALPVVAVGPFIMEILHSLLLHNEWMNKPTGKIMHCIV